MAATDDILLRVLAETSGARREVALLQGVFIAALNRMAEAARRPDFDPLSAEARALSGEVQRTGANFKRAFDVAEQEVKQAAAAMDAARRGVRSLDQELDRLGKSGKASLGQVSASLESIKAIALQMGAALGVGFGGREILNFVKDAALARIELQALRAQLDAAAGSTAAGGRAFEFARDKAIELGFSLNDVVQAQARFEASTRQSNLTLAQRRDLFESIIETGRVLQLSQERVNNAFLALEQIASKGRVSMEELRRQLGDQIPGVLPILARELGVTTGELIKMVEAGQLMADDALPALERGLRKAFGPGLAAAVETDAAAIGRLKVALFELKVAFAEGFAEETSEAIKGATEALQENEGAAKTLGEQVGLIGKSAKAALVDLNPFLQALLRYNKAILDPANAAEHLAEALGIVEEGLRETEDSVEGMRPALELLAEKEREAALEAEANRLVNEKRVLKIYGESIPALKALATEQENLAELIKRANAGDEEAKQKLKDLIELARERVPALRAMFEELDELSVAEDKHKTVQEQIAEALARSAEEQEEFNQKLFESQGNLYKSGEELDKLKNQLLEAVNTLVTFGAISVEQTDKALDFALKLAAGYRAMGEAVPTDLVEKIDALAAASVEGAQKVVKALREEADAYSALGEAIPEDLIDRIERLTEVTEDHERAIALSVLGMKDFREELLGSGADIETRSLQIVKLVESLGLLGPATEEQTKIIREAIQEQLDAYAEMGEAVPPELQRIADRFGVVTSRIEEQRKALAALVDDFAKLADKIKTARGDNALSKELAAQREELAQLEKAAGEGPISIEQLNRMEELERSISNLESETEGLGSAFDRFGDEAVASVEEVDSVLRELIRNNSDALAILPLKAREAIENVLNGLQASAVEGTATEEVIRDAMQQVAGHLRGAGVETEALTRSLEDAAGGGLNLGKEFGNLGDETDSVAEAMRKYQEGVKEAGKEQEDTAEKASELGEAVKKAADATVAEAERMKPVLLEIDEIFERIVEKCERWRACLSGAAA